MPIAIDRPGYSHARRDEGQNITPHIGGLDVLDRSPTAKNSLFLLRVRAAEIDPRPSLRVGSLVVVRGGADIGLGCRKRRS
jgi:hypothetical protein